ncbi:voltage-gated chloride channel family protein [soil metagenome]
MKTFPRKSLSSEPLALVVVVLEWIVLGAGVGVLAGLASAGFLWLLDLALASRDAHPALLYGLPLAGAAIGFVYHHFGGSVAGGNNLLLDEIHEPKGPIPFRMAPLILVTTVVTHLFGGSAGREGSAVQMGGTFAGALARTLGLSKSERRILLMAGIAAGFGSVFGTPLAGAIFGMEVLALGRMDTDALVPCLVASVVGDLVCRGVGIHHHAYDAPKTLLLTPSTLGWTVLASFLFAAASAGFAELTHAIGGVGKEIRGAPWVRPAIGGLVVIAMTIAVGSQEYNGLGLPLIERAFHRGEVAPYAFALKLLFTAVTLGAGFKGGEVTPLFCIGATLGSAFAGVTGQDPALFAALGFVAVFAGAANTPLACAVMGIELFGAPLAVPLAVACVLTYVLSGHRGIYLSQKVHHPKIRHARIERGRTLRSLHREGFHIERPTLGRLFNKANDDEP